MDHYNYKKPDWRDHPAAVAASLLLFFPLGLYLVWRHPKWSDSLKWKLTGATAVYALVLFASGKDKAQRPSSNVSSSEFTQDMSEESADEVDRTGYELGKQFELGNYKYTILSVETTNSIGQYAFGEFLGEVAAPNATFVIVNYIIENCTDESQLVLADDFKLIDSKGRKFTSSSKVSTALLMHSDDKDFLLSELQPGIPRRLQQGFELPADSVGSVLTLVVPEKGFFSVGEARLKIVQ